MSDYDSDMDVDEAPIESPEITFTSISKGKSATTAANLPITALDSLPWVEKYRPSTISEIQGHTSILTTIQSFITQNQLPHLLFYGPPGTGKTSTVLALARGIYGGERNMRQMVLELNASDERGIDVVREQIKTFASTRQIFAVGTQTKSNGAGPKDSGGIEKNEKLASYKMIILDEADAMTSTAQMALRRIMEKVRNQPISTYPRPSLPQAPTNHPPPLQYTANVRFCIIANYTHKLSPALLSRCTRFRFSPLPQPDILAKVEQVIAAEQIKIEPAAIGALVKLAKGDMRRALNVLQACHAGSLPLEASLGPAARKMSVEERERLRDTVDEDKVYDCVASPHPVDVQTILATLLESTDITAMLTAIGSLKAAKGLALADIVTCLAEEMQGLEGVSAQTRILWLEGLSDVEYRVAGGGNEVLQLGGMVGVVREGCELISANGS